MLTIGLGFLLRAVANAIWGAEPRTLDVRSLPTSSSSAIW